MTHNYQEIKTQVFEKLRNELPPVYKYHSFEHTQNMISVAPMYIEEYNFSEEEVEALHLAILFHDLGFTVDWREHELQGSKMAEAAMIDKGYSTDAIRLVQKLIMATKIPQNPQSDLEKLICDVDLDYLGRDDYFQRSELLFEEWLSLGMVENRKEWEEKELKFLENHHFHSLFGINYRQPVLEKNLRKIQSK